MKIRLILPLLAVLALQLSACAPAMKSYADPRYHKTTAAQLSAFDPPLPVRVEVKFLQQGVAKPSSDLRLRTQVEQALQKSRVFILEPQSTSVFRVVVDNVGDVAAGRMAGVETGLSLGFSGAVVTDEYQFNISYTGGSAAMQDSSFTHEMHTAIGGVDLPAGVAAVTPAAAFGQIVEDAVLAKVQQLQDERVIVNPAVTQGLQQAAIAREVLEQQAAQTKAAEQSEAAELAAAKQRAAALKAPEQQAAKNNLLTKKPRKAKLPAAKVEPLAPG